jgi:hypothetical protein
MIENKRLTPGAKGACLPIMAHPLCGTWMWIAGTSAGLHAKISVDNFVQNTEKPVGIKSNLPPLAHG